MDNSKEKVAKEASVTQFQIDRLVREFDRMINDPMISDNVKESLKNHEAISAILKATGRIQ